MSGEFFLVAFALIVGLGGYWVFKLMPRQRDFVKRQQMARSLAAGDEVITGGGVVGRVQRIDSEMGVAYVEIADGVEIRVLTAALLDRYDPAKVAKNAQIGTQSTSTDS
jgi:preprotein translocase YajC subunit